MKRTFPFCTFLIEVIRFSRVIPITSWAFKLILKAWNWFSPSVQQHQIVILCKPYEIEFSIMFNRCCTVIRYCRVLSLLPESSLHCYKTGLKPTIGNDSAFSVHNRVMPWSCHDWDDPPNVEVQTQRLISTSVYLQFH